MQYLQNKRPFLPVALKLYCAWVYRHSLGFWFGAASVGSMWPNCEAVIHDNAKGHTHSKTSSWNHNIRLRSVWDHIDRAGKAGKIIKLGLKQGMHFKPWMLFSPVLRIEMSTKVYIRNCLRVKYKWFVSHSSISNTVGGPFQNRDFSPVVATERGTTHGAGVGSKIGVRILPRRERT